MDFASAFAELPLVAILRGLRPDEAVAVGDALLDAGFTLIEVPLNSPDPFDSIARLVKHCGDRALVGAGTVLTVEDVSRLAGVGGRLSISPNTDTAVIAAAVAADITAMPGYFTLSEAFAALAAGASALKLFPAEGASPAVLKAQRAVLPRHIAVLPVGGIDADIMAPWRAAGASGFGLGSALYKPGMTAAAVGAAARGFVTAWRAAAAGPTV